MNHLLIGVAQGRYAKTETATPAAATIDPLTMDSAVRQRITHDSASDFGDQFINSQAVAAINEWAATSDLEDGETYADRLLAMFVGIADEDMDGELSDDEQEVVGAALNAGFDWLVKLGVPEDDAESLLSDWGTDVAMRVRELVATKLPDGPDAEDEEIENFVFDADALETTMDAAYRKVAVIRRGKKVRINKRIAGRVRLSAAQKVAIKKARRKAFSPRAMARRAKSLRLRRSMGLS